MQAPETITISSGPVNARTDPETGVRWYRWGDRELPSVTSLRRVAGMPHNLAAWQVSKVVERATTETDKLNEMLTRERRPRERALESNRRAEAGKWLRAASNEERDASAAIGTAVHDAAAAGMVPADVPEVVRFVKDGRPVEVAGDDVRPRLGHYRDWLASSGAEIVAAEFQVANLTVGYAGSADLLCRFPGGLWLIDLKTGTGTYPEHALQLCAYRRAEFAFEGTEVLADLTAHLPRIVGIAILHLTKDGWTFTAIRETPDLWEAFLGLHAFATWSNRHPRMESLIAGERRSAPAEEKAA